MLWPLCVQGSDHHSGERGGRCAGCWNPPPHQPAGDEEAAGAAAAARAGGSPGGGGGQRSGGGGDLATRHAQNQSVRGHAGSHRVCPVNSARLIACLLSSLTLLTLLLAYHSDSVSFRFTRSLMVLVVRKPSFQSIDSLTRMLSRKFDGLVSITGFPSKYLKEN